MKKLTTIYFFIFQLVSLQVFASSMSMLLHTGTDGHIVKSFHHGVSGTCAKTDRLYSCEQIKIDLNTLSSKDKNLLEEIRKVLKYPSEKYFEIQKVEGQLGTLKKAQMKIGSQVFPINEGEYFPEEGSLVLSFRFKLSKLGVKKPLQYQNKSVSDVVSLIVTVPYK